MAEAAVTVPNESHLAMLRQAGMLVGIAASVALGLYVVMWTRTPNFSPLYANLSDKDISQIVATLSATDIAYRLEHASGTIMVPSSEVDEARLKLAAAGLPKSAGMGFELLDEDQGFGSSQFLERARYQRAIEGELSRSIAHIDSVRAARVHLALPRETVFARSKRTPSASVIVDLYQGHRLEPHQVGAVVHLVAASVPSLSTSRVTVVDQQGNLLTDQDGSADMVQATKRFDHTRRIEQSYIDRIEAILAPFVGEDGVRAQATVEIDYTATEQTQESYNPDLPAIRSERVVEEEHTGAGGGGGIPGALSNQPPTEAAAPEQAIAAESADPATQTGGDMRPAQKSNNRSKQMTRNYELDHTISHTKPSPGVVRRLSVAVVVRNPTQEAASTKAGGKKKGKGKTEKVAAVGYTPEQMERMTNLVKEAIGFDAGRGDTVQISNTDFLQPAAPEPLPEPPIWRQPWIWAVAKQTLGGLFVLFLLLGVLRPAMKSLMARQNAAADQRFLAGGTAALPAPGGGGLMQTAGGGGAPGQASQLALPGGFEGNIEQVKQYVNQDPRIAAQVVRGWVGDGK